MTRKFSLIRQYPVGFGTSSQEVVECIADNLEHAIELLEPHSPVMLNKTGQGTDEDDIYIVREKKSSRSSS